VAAPPEGDPLADNEPVPDDEPLAGAPTPEDAPDPPLPDGCPVPPEGAPLPAGGVDPPVEHASAARLIVATRCPRFRIGCIGLELYPNVSDRHSPAGGWGSELYLAAICIFLRTLAIA
jgi:hypothetical protein